MRFVSVCSGIEAASVAWEPLGWKANWFSEIAKFPSQVLAHHYPDTPNLGDMQELHKRKEFDRDSVGLLVGGTPCQSFSVAGLRKGMADPRGNLALVFLSIAGRLRPSWLVWENVPGVLSSNEGRDFGSFLGGLAELGYGFAYRVLDAQYLGVAQRRRRVFVVGHLGDWRPAAAVLFERDCLSGNPPPRREARARSSKNPENGSGSGIARTLTTRGGGRHDESTETFVAHTLRGGGFDASEDGTGRGIPLVSSPLTTQCRGAFDNGFGSGSPLIPEVSGTLGGGSGTRGWADDLDRAGAFIPIPFDTTQITHRENRSDPQPGDPCPSIAKQGHAPAVAFQCHGSNVGPMGTLRSGNGNESGGVPFVASSGVRRLTPRECERLQGFPDDYTRIPWRGKSAEECPDGPRYQALGNSMAVPVMGWIGKRIQDVERLKQ